MEEGKSYQLDYNQILEYQADRYPYLFFDRVLEVIPGKKCIGIKNLSMNEWFFPVHFPGDPCMPGFLQAEAMTQVGALTILTLGNNKGKQVLLLSCENLKLHKKARPGDVLEIHSDLLSYRHGIARCKCYIINKLQDELGGAISSCEVTFTISDSEERKLLTPKI